MNRARRLRRVVLGVVSALLVAATATFRNPLFHGNFGVVEAEHVYRSAQPVEDLPRLIDRYGLQSILNLRGGSYEHPWYAAEVRETRERGVDFYDLPMSATRRPHRHELLILLDLFERCRYPLLIHCKSGSDRTGLAAALYRMSRGGESPERAIGAFSIHYGHVPVGGPEHLHEPLDEYRAWLESRRLAHRPELLRNWIERVYASDSPEGQGPPLQPGPRRPLSVASPTPPR